MSEQNADARELPSALMRVDELLEQRQGRRLVVFLDFDGTLAPIVSRPELAELSPAMREALRTLGRHCTLAIVSGRDLADIRAKVGLEELFYSGSHGFQIGGPDGFAMELPQGQRYLSALQRAERELLHQLGDIPGAQVERKKFAVAVHYRRVAEEQVPAVTEVVERVLMAGEGLRKTGGKMIYELRPDLEWDKGKGVSWLLEELQLDRADVMPVYIGDDLTDEDAFRELRRNGIGILVREEHRPTLARYALDSIDEVGVFLQRLATRLEEGAASRNKR